MTTGNYETLIREYAVLHSNTSTAIERSVVSGNDVMQPTADEYESVVLSNDTHVVQLMHSIHCDRHLQLLSDSESIISDDGYLEPVDDSNDGYLQSDDVNFQSAERNAAISSKITYTI